MLASLCDLNPSRTIYVKSQLVNYTKLEDVSFPSWKTYFNKKL